MTRWPQWPRKCAARLARRRLERSPQVFWAPLLNNPRCPGVINYFWFFLAAVFEIGGCYAFYLWLRLGKSAWWIAPALFSLTLFGLILTRVEAAYAGRAYAAYGGIYIVTSLIWLAVIERARPLSTDWMGALLCVLGATLIVLGPRFHNA